MGYEIYTPTAEEVDARIGRFNELKPMSTTDEITAARTVMCAASIRWPIRKTR